MRATARIAPQHGSFNRIRQVAPICNPALARTSLPLKERL